MEAPARGMLRRPVGLLPSATTRAANAPETMGHVAETMTESGTGFTTGSTRAVSNVVSNWVAEAAPGLTVAIAMPMTEVTTVPMGMVRHEVHHAR